MKKILYIATVLLVIASIAGLSACGLFGATTVPGGKQNTDDGKDDETPGNEDKDDDDKEDDETDAARAELIASLLELIRTIQDGGDYYEALYGILSAIEPDDIKNLLGNSVDAETAALIEEYYGTALAAIGYAQFILPNIDMIYGAIGTILAAEQMSPYYAQVALAAAGITKNGNAYTFRTYTLTIVDQTQGIYRVTETEKGLDFTFKRVEDGNYLINDNVSQTSYDIVYDKISYHASIKAYEGEGGEHLFTAENVKVGNVFYIQYYDNEEDRLIQITLLALELKAEIGIQDSITEEPQSILIEMPADFGKKGLQFSYSPDLSLPA